MRELALCEQNEISGGTSIAAIAAIAGGLAFIYWATRSARQCETLYRKEISYGTEVVPLYDAYGRHTHDQTNVYENVNYVPVTICH